MSPPPVLLLWMSSCQIGTDESCQIGTDEAVYSATTAAAAAAASGSDLHLADGFLASQNPTA